MRNPHRRRTAWLSLVAAGLVMGTGLFLSPENPGTIGWSVALACASLLAVIFGCIFAISAHRLARARTALLQDKDVLARWRVDGATWEQFVALNRTFSINEIAVPATIPPDGLEVIVGRSGLLIGEHVHTFNHSAKLKGVVLSWGGDWTILQISLGGDTPCCLYFYVGMGGSTARVCTNLILPVPPHAVPEARAVLNYFHAMLEALK